MSESLGEAVLDLTTDNADLESGVAKGKKSAQSLDKTFQQVGKNLSGFGDKMTTRVALPIAGVSAAAFKLAADAAEASNKFEIVMGGSADRVRERLKSLEAQIPLTTGEMLNLAAGVQDMLVPMGLARDAGADMSAQMIELAGDIAAFNNTTPAQVIDDMKSALAGSSEPLFKYGVDTRVAALEALALKEGLIEQGEALDNAARAQAVLLQIQAQSTDAMGAAAREADGAAQSTQFLWRELKQLGEEIGQVLIPIFVPLIQGLRDMVTWFRELSPTTQEWVVKIGLLVAAIGPLLSIVGRILTVGGRIAGMMTANAAATATATASTTANTAANAANARSLTGLAGKLGKATAALGAFWVGWEAGTVIKETIGIDDDWFAGILDSIGFYGESIQEITADTNEAAKATGEYRTAAEIQADVAAKAAAANEANAAAIQTVGTATEDAVDPSVKYAEALAELGIVSDKAIADELDNLALAVESGQVPAATMLPLLDEYAEKWKELGRLSPEQVQRVDDLTEAVKRQDAAIDGIVGSVPPATQAFDGLGDVLGGLPPVIEGTGQTWEQALLDMAAAGETNAFALAEMIAQQEGLTFEQAMALTQYRDNTEELRRQAEKLRGEWGPSIQESTERMLGLGDAMEQGRQSSFNFFEGILGGIPVLGELAKGFDFIGEAVNKGIGKLNEFVEKGTGFLQEKLTGLFGEGSKLGGFLSEGLGQAVGFAIPMIGPLIAPFVGKLAGLIGKGVKKIGSFFKGLFGVSEAEKQAREVANSYNDVFRQMVSSGTAAAEGLTETWQFNNVAQRDIILAMGGTIQDVEATWRRFQDAAKDPKVAAEFDAYWKERVSTVSAAMESTGLTLTELRDKAINESKRLGISVAEAFQAIADGTISTMEAATQAVETAATTSTTATAQAVTEATSTATTGLAEIEAAASSTVSNLERQVSEADLTFDVDFDVGELGLKGDGDKLEIPGFARGGVVGGPRGQAQLAVVHGGERIVPAGGGMGGGTIEVPVNLDGREITKAVVRLTPEVRRKLGLGG